MKTAEKKVNKLDAPVTLKDMSALFLENNIILLKAMDQKISDNNKVLVVEMGSMMDQKISDNNDIIISGVNEQINKLINHIDDREGKCPGGLKLSFV